MPNRHRAMLWWVAAAYLVAAAATWLAGVPVASPFVLALVALAAFALGFTDSPPGDDGQDYSLRGHVTEGRTLADDEPPTRSGAGRDVRAGPPSSQER